MNKPCFSFVVFLVLYFIVQTNTRNPRAHILCFPTISIGSNKSIILYMVIVFPQLERCPVSQVRVLPFERPPSIQTTSRRLAYAT